jgi:hypothetical protein
MKQSYNIKIFRRVPNLIGVSTEHHSLSVALAIGRRSEQAHQ